MHTFISALVIVAISVCLASPVSSQVVRPSPLSAALQQQAGAVALELTLESAIARGLTHHLAALVADAGVKAAAGRRLSALSALLPQVNAQGSAVRQKINLAAFGFRAPGFPDVIGPFNVYDGRLHVSQPIVDLAALNRSRGETVALDAARYDERDARRFVALVVTNLYLESLASASRIEAGRAELATATALYTLAEDLRTAGLVPRIDVLRAQVQRETAEQRQIALENALEKSKLALAQAIGLTPLTQPIVLADRLAFVPAATITFEGALGRAQVERADLRAAESRVAEREAKLRAEREWRLPTLHVEANYGSIGATVGLMRPTYSAAAAVSVPLFDGQAGQARVLGADAELQRARAEADDLRGRVAYDVRAALLDLQAAERQVQVASHTVELATEQQTQAEDRFKAGVTTNLELVQAQAALAAANDAYIAGVSAHNFAKVALARAIGIPEQTFPQFIAGATP